MTIKAKKQRSTQKNYDLWSDPNFDNYDYKSEINKEYKELGYNPREITAIGKEKQN